MIRGYVHCQLRRTVHYGLCARCPGAGSGCPDARHEVEAMLDHHDTTMSFLEAVQEQAYIVNDFNTHASVSIAIKVLDDLCRQVGGPDWRKYGMPVADAG